MQFHGAFSLNIKWIIGKKPNPGGWIGKNRCQSPPFEKLRREKSSDGLSSTGWSETDLLNPRIDTHHPIHISTI
jgi:hypothetical protein